MEQATKTVKEKPKPSTESKKEGTTPKQKENTRKKETKIDQKLTASQKLIGLKRDLTTMVTNIQAAAEDREVKWRTETDKARKIRLELLNDHNLVSKDKLDEISKGWKIAKEKVIPQEVQAALVHQQQLCADLIKDNNKIIDAIQQDLKKRDDSFVADLKKQTEELQLMLERMDEQAKTLTKAYREELKQWMENVQKEEETIRTEERTAWEQSMKKLLETTVDKLLKRQQTVSEYDAEIRDLMFESSARFNLMRSEEVTIFQNLEMEIHQVESEKIFMQQKITKQNAESDKLKAEDGQIKAKLSSLKSEMRKLWVEEHAGKKGKEKQQKEKLLKELNRKAQDYERIQKKILHFAVADAIKFETMWLTVEAEVKELLERALVVDSLIYEYVLHLPWEQPNLNFTESGKRSDDRRAISQTSPSNQERANTSQTDADVIIEGFYNDSESEAEVGHTAEADGAVSPWTVKRLMELLCDEAGFLIEVKIVKLLDTLEENEQTLVKMGYLFNTLGIEEEDVPKLVDFLYKYGQQRSKEKEDGVVDVATSNTSNELETNPVTPDPIDRNDVLHALKCFLDRYKQGSTNAGKWSLKSLEARDMSKEVSYWESMGNIITADKLRIWEATENNLEQHHAVLSEISELSLEIESLQQENTELQMVCMFLQQVCMDQSLDPDVTQLDME